MKVEWKTVRPDRKLKFEREMQSRQKERERERERERTANNGALLRYSYVRKVYRVTKQIVEQSQMEKKKENSGICLFEIHRSASLRETVFSARGYGNVTSAEKPRIDVFIKQVGPRAGRRISKDGSSFQ